MRHQSGLARDLERADGRDRRALRPPAVHARPHLRQALARSHERRRQRRRGRPRPTAASRSSRRRGCAPKTRRRSRNGRTGPAARSRASRASCIRPSCRRARRRRSTGSSCSASPTSTRQRPGCDPKERQERLAGVRPMLIGQDDVHLVRDGASRAQPAPVSVVISTRIKPGCEGGLPGVGAAHRRRADQSAGISRLPLRTADPRRAGRLAVGAALRQRGQSREMARLAGTAAAARRGQALHRGIPRPRGAHRLRAMVPDRRRQVRTTAGLEAEPDRAAAALSGRVPVRHLCADTAAVQVGWACRSRSRCSWAMS